MTLIIDPLLGLVTNAVVGLPDELYAEVSHLGIGVWLSADFKEMEHSSAEELSSLEYAMDVVENLVKKMTAISHPSSRIPSTSREACSLVSLWSLFELMMKHVSCHELGGSW